jgi:hypothetical protein
MCIPTDPETFSSAALEAASTVFSAYIQSKGYRRGGPRRVVIVVTNVIIYRTSRACHRYHRAGIVSTDAVMGGESGRIAIELNKSKARVINAVK